MSYVDGFVLPVPTKNLAAYKRMAKLGAKIWMEHGALEYRECVADDVQPGKLTSFPQSVKLKRRDRDFRLDRLQVSREPRPHQCKGDERPAPGRLHGSEIAALRWQADVLGWIQDTRESLRSPQ
jgi:Protein of unknown function (DUF1428)